jgi:serine/threonine protein kinase
VSQTAHSIALPERYRLAGHIANGGMAAVWAAEDLTLGRMVAIKVLAEHLGEDQRVVARFQREARAAASLNHPNVVTVYDVAEYDGRPFLVMERLTGGTLADVLRRGAPPRADALRWLREAASALDVAHARGIVHRDIKPGNLLLDSNGRLAVADFGIARVAHDQTVTATGQVLGTAAYIAPEQALGDPATDASDRYALAVVAYELLTGRRPFQAEHFAAQARQHIEDDPERPSDHAPELGPEVDRVLLRGMAKDPQNRWPSATAFVDALEQAANAEPTAATRRMPATNRFRRAGAAGAGAAAGARSETARAATQAPVPDRPRTPPPTPPRSGASASSPRRGASGRRLAPLALLAGGLLLAGVVLAALVGGGDAEQGQTTAPRTSAAKKEQARTATQQQDSAATPAPVPSGESDAGKASSLNDQGFELMRQGRAAEAVPILRQAVEACGGEPTPTSPCAYAMFNLGKALVDSGNPADAIPVLEKRLQNDDQQSTVQAELDRARALVSGGGGKAKGKKKKNG